MSTALTATRVYSNHVTLYASVFMWPEIGINYTSASLVNEGKPLRAMT